MRTPPPQAAAAARSRSGPADTGVAFAEQRQAPRHRARVFVDIESDSGSRCEYATTLGARGLFIETEDPLPVGANLKLRFRLPGGHRLHTLGGRVVRTQEAVPETAEPPGMGVEFVPADVDAAAELERELEELL